MQTRHLRPPHPVRSLWMWWLLGTFLWLLGAVSHAQTATTTTLNANKTSAVVGEAVALTATVAPSAASGTVTFKSGATVLGSATLSAGSASLNTSFATATASARTLTAVYAGNASYKTSKSAGVALSVGASPTTVVLATPSPTPSSVAQAVTLSATITPSTATGNITFRNGTTSLGSAPITAGVATLTKTFASAGALSLTAQYAGNANYLASTSAAVNHTVEAITTTVVLATPSPTPSSVAQAVTLSATITPSTATGNITFRNGTTSLGSAPITAGVATLTKTFAAAGALSLTAQYAGNANYLASTSPAVNHTVEAITTTVVLATPSPTPSSVAQAVTLSATITPSTTPGNIIFRNGTTSLGSAPITAGVATLTKTFAAAGALSLTAQYAGNTNYLTSTSPAVSHTVEAAATTLVLLPTPSPSAPGQPVSLQATITPSTATGKITFKSGTTTLGSDILTGGSATLSNTFATVGTQALTASYAGNANYLASTSAVVNHSVANPATSTTLSVLPAPATTGQPVTLRASVSPASASGSVTFTDGSTTLGSGTLSNGVATYTTAFATPGTHALSAKYAGNGNLLPSTSATYILSVNGPIGPLPPPSVGPGTVVNLTYDANGNPTGTLVAPGQLGPGLQTSIAYDSLQRPRQVTDAAGGQTQLGYARSNEHLSSVSDPKGLLTTYSRDGLGQTHQHTSPDSGTSQATYDSAGNLTQATDSRGAVSTYRYDALNRLTSATHTPDPAQSSQPVLSFGWLYDQNNTFSTYSAGRLSTATFPEGNTQYAYTSQGQLSAVRQNLHPNANANPSPQTHTLYYSHDAAGTLTRVTYPSGLSLNIAHSNPGTPSALNFGGQDILTGLQLDPMGQPQNWQWAMGSAAPSPSVAHSFIRDTQGRLIRHSLGPWLRDIGYDAAGRISGYSHWYQTSATASINGVNGNNGNNGEGYADPAPDQSFAYDSLGRLTQVQTPQASWAYQYDANGNRTQVQLASGPNIRTSSYTTAPDSNRLLGTSNPALSLSHDAAGNLISDGQYTLTIDASGRISQLATPQNTTATYAHNNQGLRVRKHGDANGTGGATLFVYDLHTTAGGLPSSYPHLIGEYDSSGAPIREYIWLGDTPVAMAMPDVNTPGVPKLFYIHTDHLATPRIVIERSNGAPRWRWMGEPFGTSAPEERVNGAPALTQPLRFPGQYADAESGMAYNGMRSYISGVGRYSQSDPIGLAGGINTYGYVGGNPLNTIDPLGLAGCVVNFPDYPIDTGFGFSSSNLGGHGGVLTYDANGSTQYYEYGRYSPANQYVVGDKRPEDEGNVRRVPVPDLVIDPKTGQPTPASLDGLKKALSERVGHKTKTDLTCEKDADEKRIKKYAEDYAKSQSRPAYSWKPWSSNQCRDFAHRAVGAGL